MSSDEYHESPTDAEFEKFCITNLGKVVRPVLGIILKYIRDRDRYNNYFQFTAKNSADDVELLRVKDKTRIELPRDK